MVILIGYNYNDDEIREGNGSQIFQEEVPLVQSLLEKLYIPQTIHEHFLHFLHFIFIHEHL